MTNNFDVVMANETDAQLLKILTEQRNDYQPAAVEAAEREFAKRNLSQEKIESAKKELIQKKQALEAKAQEPLAGGWKAFLFLLPGLSLLGVGVWILISHAEGRKQSRNDILRWTFYGFCFWAGVFVLLSLADRLST